jgi:dUTP pyrophosphatase
MIKFKRLDYNDFDLPEYKTEHAACFDVAACLTRKVDVLSPYGHKAEYNADFSEGLGKVSIEPGFTAIIPSGWALEFPHGHVLLVAPRSSAIKTRISLGNTIGIIDSDYRGELFIGVRNHGSAVLEIEHGDRIIQAMLIQCEQHEIVEVDELSATERGSGGLGSTGTK